MGQFKPMVKMMTTEPSVELKLKKGGKVAKKADGGMMGSPMSAADIPAAMPARGGLPMAGAPMKPSLAMRRRAMRGMPSGAGPAGPVGSAASMPAPGGMPAMKKGGKAKHDDAAQDRAMIKKAMAGKKFATGGAIPSETTSGSYASTEVHSSKADSAKGSGGVKNGNGGGYKKGGMTKMATGGVVKGQAGYATGGSIPSRSASGSPATTIVETSKPDNAPADTKGVRNGNAGGYKKGGSTKKAYAAGGTVNSGRAVVMPQASKPAAKPIRINELTGAYKTGGRVAPGNRALQSVSNKENAPAVRAAKAMNNQKYGSASTMKFSGGGPTAQGAVTNKERKTLEDLSGGAYDKTGKVNRDLEDALNPLSMVKELAGKARDYFMPKGADSVTKTKESVTVSPGKKRGGSVKC